VANIGLRPPDADINQLRERCSPQALDWNSHPRLDRTSGRPQAGSAEPPDKPPGGFALHDAGFVFCRLLIRPDLSCPFDLFGNFVRAGRLCLRAALSAAVSSLLPGAVGLALPLHGDKLRTSFPLNYSRTQFHGRTAPTQGSSLTKQRFAFEVAQRTSRSSLWCPMQPRPDPRRRLVLAHLEYPADRLDLGPHAPPGDEGAGEGSVTC
jgi:hypothetical protein